MCALAVLGVWYVRNNAGHQWKKSTLSTYVSSLRCFCLPPPPRRWRFFDRMFVLVARPRPSTASSSSPQMPTPPKKIFSINENLSQQLKPEITSRVLVSTTNPRAINSSSIIAARKSLTPTAPNNSNGISHQQVTDAPAPFYNKKPPPIPSKSDNLRSKY